MHMYLLFGCANSFCAVIMRSKLIELRASCIEYVICSPLAWGVGTTCHYYRPIHVAQADSRM